MSYFFFDLFDGSATLEDHAGLELADVGEAIEQARNIAFTQLRSAGAQPDPIDARELRVRESAGKCVAKVAFRYVEI